MTISFVQQLNRTQAGARSVSVLFIYVSGACVTEACGMGIALSGEKESLRERVGKCAFSSLGDQGLEWVLGHVKVCARRCLVTRAMAVTLGTKAALRWPACAACSSLILQSDRAGRGTRRSPASSMLAPASETLPGGRGSTFMTVRHRGNAPLDVPFELRDWRPLWGLPSPPRPVLPASSARRFGNNSTLCSLCRK